MKTRERPTEVKQPMMSVSDDSLMSAVILELALRYQHKGIKAISAGGPKLIVAMQGRELHQLAIPPSPLSPDENTLEALMRCSVVLGHVLKLTAFSYKRTAGL